MLIFNLSINISRIGLVFSLLLIIFSLNGCMIYSKPSFSGRVVDASSGEPIYNANVTITYSVSVQKLVEQGEKEITSFYLTTDKNGYFEAPSVFSIIFQPSWDPSVYFVVNKEGYVGFLSIDISNCMSVGCDGITLDYRNDKTKTIYIYSNLIKLPKIK